MTEVNLSWAKKYFFLQFCKMKKKANCSLIYIQHQHTIACKQVIGEN